MQIFFFLSAMGLSCSLQKNNDSKSFFIRRLRRIIPTFFFFLLLVHLVGIRTGWPHPTNFLQGICWYTTLGWWFNGMFAAPYNYSYEWYIPTLLVFYLVAPFLFKMSSRALFVMTICGMLVSLLFANYHFLDNLRWSIQRVPIFVSGFLFYRMINNVTKKGITLLFAGLIGGIILLSEAKCISGDNNVLLLSIYRCSLVLAMPMFLLLISKSVETCFPLQYVLKFLGGISFEIYLLHIYNRPLNFVRDHFVHHSDISIALTFVVIVVSSYLIHFVINKIGKFIL